MFRRSANATFKPPKKALPGSRRYELHKHAAATLNGGRLLEAVRLPTGENLYDWLTVNAVVSRDHASALSFVPAGPSKGSRSPLVAQDFFNELSLLYGILCDTCTPSSCPTMSAGSKFEYKWADGVSIKKPIRCSAPKYIDLMMTWAQTTLDDETIFPIRAGEPFPSSTGRTLRAIFKRLFRVYAHMYAAHFRELQGMGAEPHLNTCFRHFILFVKEFDLIEAAELSPLADLIDRLVAKSLEQESAAQMAEVAAAARRLGSLGDVRVCGECHGQGAAQTPPGRGISPPSGAAGPFPSTRMASGPAIRAAQVV